MRPPRRARADQRRRHVRSRLQQQGLLRSLTQGELSDGTLRYRMWIAALLTPRPPPPPPPLTVLNEPETSLHPDLLLALARLIEAASARTQIIVVSHAARLVAALVQSAACQSLMLEKTLGATTVPALGRMDVPTWHWPPR